MIGPPAPHILHRQLKTGRQPEGFVLFHGLDLLQQIRAEHAGAKETVMEGGFRAPMVIGWPGRIPAGNVENSIVSDLAICSLRP
jgi:hypothetical protein